MPPLERTDLLHTAVFWHLKKVDGYANPVLGEPVEIDCRWTDQQSRALDPNGNTVTVDATVVVDDDIEQFASNEAGPFWPTIIGGMLWRGGLYDLPGTGFVPPDGIMQVKTYNATDDLKAREARRVVGLMRFTDTLPEVSP